LLTDDGAIFISIDDNEVDNLKKICNEIYGEENFVAQFPWRKRTAKSDVPFGVSQDYEWILCFAKSSSFIACVEGKERKYYETPDLPGRPWRIHDMTTQRSASERPNSYFTMVNPKTGEEYPANPNSVWRITKETFQEYYDENRIVFPGDYDFLKISKPVLRYFKEDDEKRAGNMFGFVPMSTNLPKEVGMTQDGTKDIDELFSSKVFGFPKPVSLLKYLIKAATAIEKDSIVLDFFSGSATTAHAVMELNAEDGGNRKFIMVQLPEPTDEKSEAYKAGYKNICEIGKERIRRAGEKIKEEYKDKEGIENLDIGFKVFKLDTSNIRKWQPDYDNLEQSLLDYIDNFVEGRTELDVVYEIMLKYGLDLTYPVDEFTIAGKKVYSIGYGMLMICLDNEITTEVAKGILAKIKELSPESSRVVFKDNGFKSDSNKTNIKEILKSGGIEEFITI
jgi:adenine-specific DNA-methyltransferase